MEFLTSSLVSLITVLSISYFRKYRQSAYELGCNKAATQPTSLAELSVAAELPPPAGQWGE